MKNKNNTRNSKDKLIKVVSLSALIFLPIFNLIGSKAVASSHDKMIIHGGASMISLNTEVNTINTLLTLFGDRMSEDGGYYISTWRGNVGLDYGYSIKNFLIGLVFNFGFNNSPEITCDKKGDVGDGVLAPLWKGFPSIHYELSLKLGYEINKTLLYALVGMDMFGPDKVNVPIAQASNGFVHESMQILDNIACIFGLGAEYPITKYVLVGFQVTFGNYSVKTEDVKSKTKGLVDYCKGKDDETSKSFIKLVDSIEDSFWVTNFGFNVSLKLF